MTRLTQTARTRNAASFCFQRRLPDAHPELVEALERVTTADRGIDAIFRSLPDDPAERVRLLKIAVLEADGARELLERELENMNAHRARALAELSKISPKRLRLVHGKLRVAR